MKKQVRVYYAGRVQGVGFRFSAEETAQQLRVVGWVKNLRDGRVELMAQGDEESLKRFLAQMRNGPMRNFIRDTQVTWGSPSGSFREFEIRYAGQ